MLPSPASLIPAAAVALALAAAAPAAADSIAYVKDGDVHVTDGNGHTTQVTHTGDNAYVSQADDGTLATLAPRERLRTVARDGRVLAEFPAFVSDGAPQAGPVSQFAGPFNPEISPDGKLIAFEWFHRDYSETPQCSSTSVPSCAELTSSQGVGISRAGGYTGFDEYGLLTGWIGPQWLSSTKLVRSFANSTQTEDAVFNEIAPGRGDDDLDRWLYDDTGGLLYEVELSRDRSVMAAIGGFSDEQLRLYRPTVEPFGAPDPDMGPFAHREPLAELCATIPAPAGGRFESVSISPDARRIAYGTGEGVFVADLAGCTPGAGRLIAAGGRFPHFGPAGVPAATPGPQQPGPDAPAGARLKLRAPASIRVSVARRRGIAVTATLPAAGRVELAATQRGRRAGRVRRSGDGTMKLRVKVKRARPGKVRVTAVYRGAGGATQKASRTVRLRRG